MSKDLDKKDEFIKKNNEEKDNSKYFIESYKKESQNLINNIERKDIEIVTLSNKINENEKEKLVFI